MTSELFDQIVAITEDYLGPSARRFVSRQITFHLGKTPAQLTYADIPRLAEWSKVTLGLLTKDRQLIAEYLARLNGLGSRVA